MRFPYSNPAQRATASVQRWRRREAIRLVTHAWRVPVARQCCIASAALSRWRNRTILAHMRCCRLSRAKHSSADRVCSRIWLREAARCDRASEVSADAAQRQEPTT